MGSANASTNVTVAHLRRARAPYLQVAVEAVLRGVADRQVLLDFM